MRVAPLRRSWRKLCFVCVFFWVSKVVIWSIQFQVILNWCIIFGHPNFVSRFFGPWICPAYFLMMTHWENSYTIAWNNWGNKSEVKQQFVQGMASFQQTRKIMVWNMCGLACQMLSDGLETPTEQAAELLIARSASTRWFRSLAKGINPQRPSRPVFFGFKGRWQVANDKE